MNTNMNMNGRKKRDLEVSRKNNMLSKFSNTTLGSNFSPEMLENFYEAFTNCKNNFGSMETECEEEIVLLSWKNMRKMLKNDNDGIYCVDPNLASSPLTTFTTEYLRY